MSSSDIDKAYVSPYDKFLYEFERDHIRSPSQEKEYRKNHRIAELRDNPNRVLVEEVIWEKF